MGNTNKKLFTNPWFVTAAALLCCSLWGSATPFIKVGYELIMPHKGVPSTILFAGMRFTLAGILTVLFYSASRKQFLFPKRENLHLVAKISCFQTIIQYFFFYVGLANTTGVKGTVISGGNVFFAIIISSLIFKQEPLTPRKIIACILGFAGIIVVNLNGLDLNMNFYGDCFVMFATISYAVSSVLIKRYSKYEDPVILSGYQFILGGSVMIIAGLLLGGHIHIRDAKGAAVLVYLAFLSAVAYSLWGVLLKYNPVSRVSIFSFTTPVFGVILSNIMLEENSNVPVTNLLITLVLVCAGIITLNYNKAK